MDEIQTSANVFGKRDNGDYSKLFPCTESGGGVELECSSDPEGENQAFICVQVNLLPLSLAIKFESF